MADESETVMRPAHWSVHYTFGLAEAIHDTPGARVKRQHVVSKTVLSNYLLKTQGAPLIAQLDLGSGVTRQVGVADAGIEKDFLRLDSLASEQLWGLTETLLPAALAASRSPGILDDPDQLQVLRQVVALHFARSISTLKVVESTWPRMRNETIRDLSIRGRPRIVAEFKSRYGRPPTDEQVLEIVHHAADSGLDRLMDSGAYARVRIEQFFDQALERFESWGVELVRVPSNELIITDNPVVLARTGDTRRRAAERLAIDEANTIVFPLAPDVLIFGRPTDWLRDGEPSGRGRIQPISDSRRPPIRLPPNWAEPLCDHLSRPERR